MDDANGLEIEHLTKPFRNVLGLDDISLDVRPGEIHAILGENGAGKTTLMKLLGGLYPPNSYDGVIRIAGEPVALRNPRDVLQLGIAILPCRPAIFSGLSVAENIVLGRWQVKRTFMVSSENARREASETLHRIGVTLDLEAQAGKLPAGQKRMVVMARALSSQPRLLVLDEPSVYAGGPAEISSTMRLLRQLAGQGMASLYLTRAPLEAAQIADRITVLRDGQTIQTVDRENSDPSALALAMMSQHPERTPGADDMQEEGGILGSLRNLFSFGSRD